MHKIIAMETYVRPSKEYITSLLDQKKTAHVCRLLCEYLSKVFQHPVIYEFLSNDVAELDKVTDKYVTAKVMIFFNQYTDSNEVAFTSTSLLWEKKINEFFYLT